MSAEQPDINYVNTRMSVGFDIISGGGRDRTTQAGIDKMLSRHRDGLNAVADSEPSPDAWKGDAECRDMDSSIFYPEKDDPQKAQKDAMAKVACSNCVVREDCLVVARTYPREKFGTWGGQTEVDRRKIQRRGQRAKAAAGASD